MLCANCVNSIQEIKPETTFACCWCYHVCVPALFSALVSSHVQDEHVQHLHRMLEVGSCIDFCVHKVSKYCGEIAAVYQVVLYTLCLIHVSQNSIGQELNCAF